MSASFLKDPNATLDWSFDWSRWLADAETITAQTVTADPGLTVNSTSQSAGVVTTWLSGGTAGDDYRVTCQITTSDGRIDDRTITIRVRER